ncbi:MAG TPA: sigma factor [Planctomycetota bacterium]
MTRRPFTTTLSCMDPSAELFVRYAARGDVDALGEVFDRTAPKLLRLAMHVARTADDAEDLLQATFVLAMRKANEFDAKQPLLPWLSGILAGAARNLARRNARRRCARRRLAASRLWPRESALRRRVRRDGFDAAAPDQRAAASVGPERFLALATRCVLHRVVAEA